MGHTQQRAQPVTVSDRTLVDGAAIGSSEPVLLGAASSLNGRIAQEAIGAKLQTRHVLHDVTGTELPVCIDECCGAAAPDRSFRLAAAIWKTNVYCAGQVRCRCGVGRHDRWLTYQPSRAIVPLGGNPLGNVG